MVLGVAEVVADKVLEPLTLIDTVAVSEHPVVVLVMITEYVPLAVGETLGFWVVAVNPVVEDQA